MSQQTAKEAAVRNAWARLGLLELPARLRLLGLPAAVDGVVVLRAFGADLELRLTDGAMFNRKTGKPASPNDWILVLHYLLCDVPVPALVTPDDWITFRDLPGGAFYLQPFLSRTAKPLVAKIGNDLARLELNLNQRFDWERVALGDFGARIHGLGNLYLTLIYSRGDDEFPPACDILFSAGVKRVYGAEDAAALASRFCMGLL